MADLKLDPRFCRLSGNDVLQFIKWPLMLTACELKKEFRALLRMSVVVSNDEGRDGGWDGCSSSLTFPCM